jgi:hypothetical protein
MTLNSGVLSQSFGILALTKYDWPAANVGNFVVVNKVDSKDG